MPKIVRFHEVGGPEVLRIEEETPKQPGRARRLYSKPLDLRLPETPKTLSAQYVRLVRLVISPLANESQRCGPGVKEAQT
jgi:hypothetical protein